MALTDDDVREILRIIDEAELDELRIETDGLSLHVLRGGAAPTTGPGTRPVERSPEPQAPRRAEVVTPDGAHAVTAPMLGTFYRAEAPGAPPYVEVGSRVEPTTVVCLIEVMKMMNSVAAGVAGTVAEILAQNAELVEHGQPLFLVTPDG